MVYSRPKLSLRRLCFHTCLSVNREGLGLCLGGGGSSIQGDLHPRGSPSVGSLSRGSLSSGSLSRGSLSRGVSVWGSLSRGVSIQGGLCPGGLCPGDLCMGDLFYGKERAVRILPECVLVKLHFRQEDGVE